MNNQAAYLRPRTPALKKTPALNKTVSQILQ